MKGKNNNKNVNNTSQRRTRRNGRKRAKPRGYTGSSNWLGALYSPFNYPATYIPDERTAYSGKVTSRFSFRGSINELSGTSSTHNFGFLVPPLIGAGLFGLNSTAAGNANLTDLSTSGLAYAFQSTWPNLDSTCGTASNAIRTRTTALGVRITYEGTELQRAGKYVAGLLPITQAASGTGTGTTKLSPLSTAGLGVSPSLTSLYQALQFKAEARVSDGVFEYNWVPNGIPSFQLAPGSNFLGAYPATSTNGASLTPSFYNGPSGQACVEGGQYMLCIFVEGDTTATAVGTANTYAWDFIMHSECIPESLYSVSYTLTPSPYDLSDLQQCLNDMEVLPHTHSYATATTMTLGMVPQPSPGNSLIDNVVSTAGRVASHPMAGKALAALMSYYTQPSRRPTQNLITY